MSGPQPGWLYPSMVIPVLIAGRGDVGAIVHEVVAAAYPGSDVGMLKSMVFGAGLLILDGFALVVLASAHRMADRNVPIASESAVIVTRYDELASYAPISTAFPALRPTGWLPGGPPRWAPRWSVVSP